VILTVLVKVTAGYMRRLCITVLTLVSCAALTAQETVVVLGHAPYSFADVPKPFRFVFQGSLPAGGLKEAWAELPFDSITLERTSCLGTCPAYGVTFYRGKSTSANDESIDDQFGQAALTVTRVSRPNAYFRRFPDATGNFEGRVDIWTFAKLSYLIQQWGLTLKDDAFPMVHTDAPAAIVTVSGPGGSKTVHDHGGVRTIELWSVHQAIDSAAKSVAWKRR
jgi:hypothetical protein